MSLPRASCSACMAGNKVLVDVLFHGFGSMLVIRTSFLIHL